MAFAARIFVIAALCLIGSATAYAQVAECDALAASSFDKTRPKDVPGVAFDKIDAPRAISACKKALEDRPNDARIKLQLGRALQKSGDNPVEAARLYREAADAGLASAMIALGVAYERGQGVSKDPSEAVNWYRKAADNGVSLAMRLLAINLQEGIGVAKNVTEATNWFHKAADAGDAIAMTYYGAALEDGLGIAKNITEANNWYRKAADAGDALGMRILGINLQTGLGIAKDERAANSYYKKAVELGDLVAMRLLARNLYDGVGADRNVPSAEALFRKANEASAGQARWSPTARLTETNFPNSPFAMVGLNFETTVYLLKKRFTTTQILEAANDARRLQTDVNDKAAVLDFAIARRSDPKAEEFVQSLIRYQKALDSDPELKRLEDALAETADKAKIRRLQKDIANRRAQLRNQR